MPSTGVHDQTEWAAVFRFRSIVTVAVAAILPVIGGCAPNYRTADVKAVSSQRTEVAPVDETVPVAAPAPEGDDGDGDVGGGVVASGDEEAGFVPVETLVPASVARPATVAVVGDSLTRSAEDEMLLALSSADLDVLAVDGVEGRRMVHRGDLGSSGAVAIENIQRLATPELWVIALGTNDVASAPSGAFRSEVQELLDLIPSDVPVIWVDVWIRDRQSEVRDANRSIRDGLRNRRAGAAVVDWYSHGDDEGVTISDGIHLTAAGRQLFVDSIVASIDTLFQS